MNTTKVSIIVPVYKVEQYLDRCVQSLLNQTYPYIEILLVDDGSPDSCPQLCDEYSQKYDNILVIHQKNQGLAGARNTGLQNITGEYVTFVDSDDWIELDAIEYAVNLLEKKRADAFQYGIAIVSTEDRISQPSEEVKTYEGKEILQYFMDSSTRKSGGYSVCRSFFKTEIAKKYAFRVGKLNEDIDYKYKVLSDCNIFIVSNLYKYYYWQGGDSLTVGGLKKKDFDLYEAADILEKLSAKETYGQIAFLGKVKKARTPMSLLCKIAYFGVSDPSIDKKEIVDQLVKDLRKNLFILLKAPIPFSRKILSVLFAVDYKLAELFIRLVK